MHVLAADGAFPPEGRFVALPVVPQVLFAEGFRREVLGFLVKNEAISDALFKRMLAGRHHSGFSAHNEVRIAAADRIYSLGQQLAVLFAQPARLLNGNEIRAAEPHFTGAAGEHETKYP